MFGFLKKKKPVVIRDRYGVFTLEKDGCGYWGKVDWLGKTIFVTLCCDSREGITADKALESFHSLMENAPAWDARLKDRCAEELAGIDGMVEGWTWDKEVENPLLTKEEFKSRLTMGFVHIDSDGSLYFDLEPGDLFGDHGVGAYADISGQIGDIGLVD